MWSPYGAAWFKPFKFCLGVEMLGFAYSTVLWDLSTGRPTFVCTSACGLRGLPFSDQASTLNN